MASQLREKAHAASAASLLNHRWTRSAQAMADMGCPQVTVKQYLLDYSNYHHQMEGWLVLILAGWVLLFWLIAVAGFRFLNFQKR